MKNTITINESANNRIATLLKSEPEGFAFTVRVDGGGCSGFQYKFDFAKPAADDIMVSPVVATDATSLEFLKGSELQYVEELGGSYFAMKNPNAKSSCGCGSSFAV